MIESCPCSIPIHPSTLHRARGFNYIEQLSVPFKHTHIVNQQLKLQIDHILKGLLKRASQQEILLCLFKFVKELLMTLSSW